MKLKVAAILLLTLATAECQTQLTEALRPADFIGGSIPDPESWDGTPRDWSSTYREIARVVTNIYSGSVITITQRITQVENGLNYLDSLGVWQQSRDLIEILPDGRAGAVQGPLKMFFTPDLGSIANASITMMTMSNKVFHTRPLGIYYFDPLTKKEVLLAAARDSASAELLPPNQILYRSAFSSDVLVADLRITYCHGAAECDVIFTRKPKLGPQDFSMDSTRALLQVRHFWSSEAHPKIRISQQLTQDVSDDTLDFGDLLLPEGKAFFWSGNDRSDTTEPATIINPALDRAKSLVPVGKYWQPLDENSAILIESARWQDVSPKLNQLPELTGNAIRPEDPMTEPKAKLSASHVSDSLPSSKKVIRVATTSYAPKGFVWDWTTVVPGSSYTFNYWTPGSTDYYYVSGPATFTGTVTFSAGCLVKYNVGAFLQVYGAIQCNGTSSSPSILTTKDDNLVAGNYPVGTGCPGYAASTAIWYYSQGGAATLTGLTIRWATTAIRFDSQRGCNASPQIVSNCLIDSCVGGIYAGGCSVTISGSIARDVQTPTTSGTGCSFIGSFGSQTSLHSYMVSTIATLISSHTLPSGTNLYTDGTRSRYNTNSLIYGVPGYTSVSKSTSYGVSTATLITRQHAISVLHTGDLTGANVTFLGSDNVQYTVQCKKELTLPCRPDCTVMVFNQPLPAAVHSVKLMPTVLDMLIPSFFVSNCGPCYTPAITLNRNAQVSPLDLLDAGLCGNGNGYASTLIWAVPAYWFPNWALPNIRGGDSGYPQFFVINGELVLGSVWNSTDFGGGDGEWPGSVLGQVNTLIDTLDTNYLGYRTYLSATTPDLSAFPNSFPY